MHIPVIPIRSRAAFTIIEVMIVLVIAAIIMLIVFAVVPALQRSNRNNQRRQDASRLLTAYKEFIVNNNGTKPSTSTAHENALKNLANAQSFDSVVVSLSAGSVSDSALDNVAYFRVGGLYSGAKCNDAKTNVGGTNPAAGAIALFYYIETATGRQGECREG